MQSEYQKLLYCLNNGAREIGVMNQLNCQGGIAYLAENGVTVDYPGRLYSEYTFSVKEFNKSFKVSYVYF